MNATYLDAFLKSADDDEIAARLRDLKVSMNYYRKELGITERKYLQVYEEARKRGLLEPYPPCDPDCGPETHVPGCHQEQFSE